MKIKVLPPQDELYEHIPRHFYNVECEVVYKRSDNSVYAHNDELGSIQLSEFEYEVTKED